MTFKKAKAEQAALKIGLYGPAGAGKTFTALLIAEGLATAEGKRVAFVDTEHGTDFYVKEVPQRQHHPRAFDIDALYTKSLTEVVREVKSLKLERYSAVVIDSMTHLWESCQLAFRGKRNVKGQIPMWAWGELKKPYKELITFLLNSPLHVIICGRQGNEFGEDEAGEVKALGYKMKAEGETQYEPHICIRIVGEKTKGNVIVPTAIVEKDRSGILQGKTIRLPNFDNVAKPLLGLLDKQQAHIESEEEAGQRDAEQMLAEERAKAPPAQQPQPSRPPAEPVPRQEAQAPAPKAPPSELTEAELAWLGERCKGKGDWAKKLLAAFGVAGARQLPRRVWDLFALCVGNDVDPAWLREHVLSGLTVDQLNDADLASVEETLARKYRKAG